MKIPLCCRICLLQLQQQCCRLHSSSHFCWLVATAAARVLSKDQHVLSNAELIVRKPAPRDQRSPSLLLLLRGIRPNTCLEMIELYVENMMGLDAADYALSPAPGRDFIFVCLSRPLSKGGHRAAFCLELPILYPRLLFLLQRSS